MSKDTIVAGALWYVSLAIQQNVCVCFVSVTWPLLIFEVTTDYIHLKNEHYSAESKVAWFANVSKQIVRHNVIRDMLVPTSNNFVTT